MTAINILRYGDAACLLTDGAIYLPDGTLQCVADKVVTLAHCNAVLAARGPALLLPLIAAHLGTVCASFDSLIAHLPLETAIAFGRHREWFKDGERTAFDLFVVGWSESRDRAESHAMFSHTHYGTDDWHVYETDPVMLLPGSEGLTSRYNRPGLDAERDGLAILEEQRRMVCPHPEGGESHHGVGGFAQLTVVRREGISTKILRRWPDRIGERLGTALVDGPGAGVPSL